MKIEDIEAAAERIAPYVRRTPLLPADKLSERAGGDVWFKAENLQRAGAFKIRGATNKLLSLAPDVRARGVVAFSSGNHAQGVALAARMLGTTAIVAMPPDSMPHKIAATQGYGARVVQEGVSTATRDAVARRLAEESGGTLVPPFDDPFIVAGQGTVGLEIVTDWPDVETVVVPTGGGGLLSGTALAVTSRKPGVRVFGVEPEAGADGRASFHSGRIVTIDPPQTIADGARTLHLGEIPFAIIRERVEDIVTVPDDALMDAVRWLALDHKLVVEPTGALAAAALWLGLIPSPGRTAVVLSGGNVAPDLFARAVMAKA